METVITQPTDSAINLAVRLIKSNKLVAFPTETVYGLGANALSDSAVKKIFIAKGRPSDNPLIVHISSIKQAKELVKDFSLDASILAKNFWPGPLTIVLKKSDKVPNIVTAGLDSVGIRIPNNLVALELIRKTNLPLAAPSANSSTKPSPTTAEHVFDDLNGKIKLILDGGKCDIGLESTVIDLTKKPYKILRPGNITKEQIEKVLGEKILSNKEINFIKNPVSPGLKYKHYSPVAKVITFNKINQIKDNSNYAVMGINIKDKNASIIYSFKTIQDYSKNLFSSFREVDKFGIKNVYVQNVKESGKGSALMNRIKKAAN